LVLDAVAGSSLKFSNDAVLEVGNVTLDAIYGADNAIAIGDDDNDAVNIYRVNTFTAMANLDIGAFDFKAQTITADGAATATAGRVLYTGASGLITAEAGFEYAANTDILTVGNIAAFTLSGTLTAGASEIGGSNFDIDGGTIDGVTIGTSAVVTDLRVGTIKLVNNDISSNVTDGHLSLSPNGAGTLQLTTGTVRVGNLNANATITTQGTGDLTLNTNSGTTTGSITIFDGADADISINPNGTGAVTIPKVDIGSGAIDGTTLGATSNVNISGATIDGSLTWSAAQNLNSQNLTSVDINSGTLNGITALGIVETGGGSEMQIAVAANLSDDRLLTINMQNAARTIDLNGNLTISTSFTTAGGNALTLTTTGTTDVTLPTSGTLATLGGQRNIS